MVPIPSAPSIVRLPAPIVLSTGTVQGPEFGLTQLTGFRPPVLQRVLSRPGSEPCLRDVPCAALPRLSALSQTVLLRRLRLVAARWGRPAKPCRPACRLILWSKSAAETAHPRQFEILSGSLPGLAQVKWVRPGSASRLHSPTRSGSTREPARRVRGALLSVPCPLTYFQPGHAGD